MVSRMNLRMLNESENEFEEKVKRAKEIREKSEIFIKYNAMIDSMSLY